MRIKSAVVARAHGLPKVHKKFDKLPKFRPIIDTTGTAFSHVGRFLSTLLQPLTLNEFTLKDTFDAATRYYYSAVRPPGAVRVKCLEN